MFAVAFFGMLFGATGVNNGLTFWQTVGSSASVFAGASQFVFLQMFNQKVPVWLILATVFAVNFRHFLYSASISRHLTHFSASLYPIWLGVTALGAFMGNLITNPNALGMDMLLSLYFLALLMGFRGRANWLSVVLASGIVSALVYKWIGAPWHITLGALAGITLAAAIGKPASAAEAESDHD